jgi:Fur family ferric uptake transcriptional regulator
MKRDNYNTLQKDLMLEKIKSINREFTIKELYELLGGKVGLTTIYRFVDKLVKDNRLDKNIGSDNTCYYEYLEECDCSNHFYLKCEDCGCMIHIHCDCISELVSHISIDHNFIPNREHIIINGLCSNCKERL